jgi:hypothetical protein
VGSRSEALRRLVAALDVDGCRLASFSRVTGSLYTFAVISAQDVSTPPSGLPILAEC